MIHTDGKPTICSPESREEKVFEVLIDGEVQYRRSSRREAIEIAKQVGGMVVLIIADYTEDQ